MSGAEIASVIGVPMFIFVSGAIYGGIKLMFRASTYMTRSAAAQEDTAKSNGEINKTLKAYMASNDGKVNDLDRRVFLIEDWRKQAEQRRGQQ